MWKIKLYVPKVLIFHREKTLAFDWELLVLSPNFETY